MKVDFPIDERSEKFLKDLESDEDISAIISLLLSRKGEDFSNYASIICFCFREKDLIDLANVKTLPLWNFLNASFLFIRASHRQRRGFLYLEKEGVSSLRFMFFTGSEMFMG